MKKINVKYPLDTLVKAKNSDKELSVGRLLISNDYKEVEYGCITPDLSLKWFRENEIENVKKSNDNCTLGFEV